MPINTNLENIVSIRLYRTLAAYDATHDVVSPAFREWVTGFAGLGRPHPIDGQPASLLNVPSALEMAVGRYMLRTDFLQQTYSGYTQRIDGDDEFSILPLTESLLTVGGLWAPYNRYLDQVSLIISELPAITLEALLLWMPRAGRTQVHFRICDAGIAPEAEDIYRDTISADLSRFTTSAFTTSAHDIALDLAGMVNSATPPSSTGALRRRPSSHGQNDVAHNLSVMYRKCYGVKGGSLFLAREFYLNSNRKVMLQYSVEDLPNPEDADRPDDEVYNAEVHKFIAPDHGWVKTKDAFHYMELTPGTYLRGVSPHNFQCIVTIKNNNIDLGARINRGVVQALVDRKFTSVQEGLQQDKNGAILSKEFLVFLGKSKDRAQEKYFLMYSDTCIGEMATNHAAFKLYSPFKQLKPALQKVLPYEIK